MILPNFLHDNESICQRETKNLDYFTHSSWVKLDKSNSD